MKLYNTLSQIVEPFAPSDSEKTTIYTCGPTVYDFPHVGNWFTFIRYDLLVRTLRAAGHKPVWVMNITDVGHLVSDADDGEDKLEKGARREGKTAWDVAAYYGDYFVEGLHRLNIENPDFLPKATEHIPEQIALVQQLEQKGYTYTIDDGVYFDTSQFEGYAEFARLDLDDQQAGARVEFNPQKRNSSDFALWKFSLTGTTRDMEWENPFGNGRKGFPGWHLECSAMAMKYLGETIDIHSGGIDHIPVHHTNEIAQSEAATGKRFANYWMHANHITIEGEKISKSLGNGITLEDIEAKGFGLDAFRLHVLESHYRSQSKFSWDSLESAQNRLRNMREVAVMRWQAKPNLETETAKQPAFIVARQRLQSQLEDDLNTPFALSQINEVFNVIERNGLDVAYLADFVTYLETIDALLGTNLSSVSDISDQQKRLITERNIARDNKDWSASDQLRDRLQAEGVGLRDTNLGTTWYWL